MLSWPRQAGEGAMVRFALLGATAILVAGCFQGGIGEEYVQRRDTVTMGAGNARDQNATTHIINPWPEYAFDRRIPMNGARAVRSVQCYEQQGPEPIEPMYDPNRKGGRAQAAVKGGDTNIQFNSGNATGSQGKTQGPPC